MSSHTRVSTDDRLVVKVFHESISIWKLPKTKTEVVSIPDDTIVLHRVLTSVGRREGEVGGRGGGRWEGEVGEGGGRRGRKGRGGQEGGQEEEAAEKGEEDKMGVKLRDRWGIQMGYLTVQ